jgi:hypothetical protein
MFNFLVGPISNLVGNAVKGFVETKKAKAELALTEIKAQKSLKEAQIAGKISWEASAVDQMKGSWKDELILICLLVPAVAVFIPGWTPHIKAGFEALHSLQASLIHRLFGKFWHQGSKRCHGTYFKKEMSTCEKCGCPCHCASSDIFVKSCENCGCVGCEHEKA